MNKLQNSLKSVSNDMNLNAEVQARIESKVCKIDNTSNKNLERIAKIEEQNVKIREEMCLLEERERRRSLNLRTKSSDNFVKFPTSSSTLES